MLKIISIIFLSLCLNWVNAQEKMLTMDDVVLGGRKELAPQDRKNLSWIPDTKKYSYIDSLNGEYGLIVDGIQATNPQMLLTLDSLNYLSSKEMVKFPSIKWVDSKHFTISTKGYYYKFNMIEKSVELLHEIPSEADFVNPTEDVEKIAYTIGNNLFISLNENEKKQVTFDTESGIVNGQTVHRVEFGIEKGSFWSPKGNYLAYYHKDERMVTEYPLVNIDTRPASLEMIRYPMAGMVSEQVQVAVYNLKTASTTYLQTGEPRDQYLAGITWSPDEKFIFVVQLNRDQNHLRLIKYDAYTGAPVDLLFEESAKKYVQPTHGPIFVKDDPFHFIWFSKREGYNHLYLYRSDGKLMRKLSSGKWDVAKFNGFDENGNYAFFTAASSDGLQRFSYKVKISSGNQTKLSDVTGTHAITLNSKGDYYFDRFNSANVARRITVCNKNGEVQKIILTASNPLIEYKLGEVRYLKLKTDKGIELNARMTLPVDFDSTKKYPVIVYVYGGPGVQLVRNSWLNGGLWMQYLAEKGYITFTLDSRGSANRGIKFEQATFRHLGDVEIEDQMVGVDYIKSLSYVDSSRIGVDGWSYGGFMTVSLMSRRPGVFKVAVAGGPVIDWRYYEVMYTERYMDTPEANPEGYEKANTLNYIQNLQGKMLLIHGTSDPVVVWQNSQLYLKKCVELGKQVDYFVYPGYLHNVRGKDRVHLMNKITEYFKLHL
jgi:dipeptidyl-peptidase-4